MSSLLGAAAFTSFVCFMITSILYWEEAREEGFKLPTTSITPFTVSNVEVAKDQPIYRMKDPLFVTRGTFPTTHLTTPSTVTTSTEREVEIDYSSGDVSKHYPSFQEYFQSRRLMAVKEDESSKEMSTKLQVTTIAAAAEDEPGQIPGMNHSLTLKEQLRSFRDYITKQDSLGHNIIKRSSRTMLPPVKCSGCASAMLLLSSDTNFQARLDTIRPEDGKEFFDHSCQPSSKRSPDCIGHHRDSNFNIHCSTGPKSTSAVTIPQHSNLCAVDLTQYKTCSSTIEQYERRSFVIVANKIVIIDSLQVKYDYDLTNPQHYKTTSSCKEKCFSTHKCGGDLAYKSNFAKNAILEDDTCKVEMDPGTANFMVVNERDTQFEYVGCYGHGLFSVKKRAVEKDVHIIKKEDFTTKCEAGKISVSSKNVKISQYKLCEGFKCINDIVQATSLDIILPPDMKATGMHAKLTLIFPKGDRLQFDVVCPRVSICSQIDCTLCLIAFLNPKCYKTIHYLMVSILISIMTVGLYTLVTVFAGLAVATKCVLQCAQLFMKISSWLTRAACRGVRRIIKWITHNRDADRQAFIDIEANQPAQVYRPVNRARARQQALAMFSLLTILTIICMVDGQSCARHTYVQSSEMTCKKSPSGRICTVNKVVELELFPHSFDSCLTLKGKNGRILKTLMFGISEVSEICEKSSGYYTADVRSYVASEVHCPGVAYCNSDWCSKVESSDQLPFSSEANDHYGQTSCVASCGSFTCGCFLPGDSCVTFRQYFKNPTSATFMVTQCEDWREMLQITTKQLQAGTSSLDKTYKLSVGERVVIDGSFSISISGGFESVKQVARAMFMTGPKARYMCSELNPTGEYSLSRFGYLQCPSEDSAKQVSKSCLSNPSIFKTAVLDNKVTQKTEVVNFRNWEQSQCNELPFSNGVYLYDYDSTGFHRHAKDGSIYRVTIELEDYEISEDIDDVTCSVKFNSLKGCFQCSTGATTSITVSASSDHTLMHIACPSGPATTLIVGELLEEKSFKLSFSKPVVNENCTVKCGDQTTYLHMNGRLDYIPSPGFQETGADTIINARELSWIPQIALDLYSSAHSYVGYLLTFMGIVAGLVVVKLLIEAVASTKQLISSKLN